MLVLSQINENFIVDLKTGLYQKIDQFTGILHKKTAFFVNHENQNLYAIYASITAEVDP